MGKKEEGQRQRLTKTPKTPVNPVAFDRVHSLRGTKRVRYNGVYMNRIYKDLVDPISNQPHEECGDHGRCCSWWFIATPASSQESSRHIWSAATLACTSEASSKSKWKLKWKMYIFRRICSVWTPALDGSRVFCKPKICSPLLVCWLNILVTKNFKQEKI